jgi:hypothetical protein
VEFFLFNDTFSKNMTWFNTQQKRVGRELSSREAEREREKVLLQKGCSAGNKIDSWKKYL